VCRFQLCRYGLAAGLDQLEHLWTNAARATLTIKGPKNEPGRMFDIALLSRLSRCVSVT
jgi:hypothetical protein